MAAPAQHSSVCPASVVALAKTRNSWDVWCCNGKVVEHNSRSNQQTDTENTKGQTPEMTV